MSFSYQNIDSPITQHTVVFVTIGLVLGLALSIFLYFVFTQLHPFQQDTFSKNTLDEEPRVFDDSDALLKRLVSDEGSTTTYSTSDLLRVSTVLQTFNTEELVKAFRGSASLAFTRNLHPIQEMLCEYLAEESPTEALRSVWLFEKHRKVALLRIVVRLWALQDSEEVLSVATGLEQPYRRIALETVVSELDVSEEILSALESSDFDEIREVRAEQMYELEIYESIDREPHAAFNSLLTDDIEDSEQVDLFSQAFSEMFHLEGFHAITKLNYLGYDTDLFDELLLQIFEQLRVVTINYVQTINVSDQSRFLYPIMENWIEVDAAAALQAVIGLSNPTYRASAYRTLLSVWGHTRPLEVIERLAEIPREYRSSAVFTAMNTLGATNPGKVLSLLPSLKAIPGAFNNENERAFVYSWALQAPDQALKWVQENVEPESEQRSRVLNWVLGEYALVQPAKAMEVAITENPNPSRGEIGLAYVVIDALLNDGQVDIAIGLLDQVPENTRAPIYADVAERLVVEGRLDDVISLSESFSATDKVYYFSSIARGLSSNNTSQVLKMVAKLPDGRLRTDVVNRILSDEWTTERYYTEKQLDTLRSLIAE